MSAGFEFVIGGVLAVLFVLALFVVVAILLNVCRKPSGLFFVLACVAVVLAHESGRL